MVDRVRDENRDDRTQGRIKREQINSAFALRQVVKDQYGQEPGQQVAEPRLHLACAANVLDYGRYCDQRPRHETGNEGAFLVIKWMRMALVKAAMVKKTK